MKSKILTFALFSVLTVFLLTGIASAAVCTSGTVCITNVVAPTIADHNSDVTVTFDITYEGTSSSTTLDFSGSTTTTGISSWKVLPSNTTPINKDQTLSLSAVLHVEENKDGTINPILDVLTGTAATDSVSLPAITINDDFTYTIAATTPLIETQTGVQNGVLTLTNAGNQVLILDLIAAGDFNVTLSPSSVTVSPGTTQSKTVTVTPVTSTTLSLLPFGSHKTTLTISDAAVPANAQQQTLDFNVNKNLCSAGVQGPDLILKNVDIKSDGSNDDECEHFDTITVEVEVDNIGTEDIDDVVVEIALFDDKGSNSINDVDFISSDDEEEKIGKIKDEKDDEVTFEFEIPSDFEVGDYRLAVKVFSEDLTEVLACDDTDLDLDKEFYQDIEVSVDDDNLVIIEDITLSVETATSGDLVRITFDVWNIGDGDEDQVKINIFNADLGINIEREIRQGIDSTEGEELELSFTVPSGIADGSYSIVFDTEYDYDSRKDEYDKDSRIHGE